MTTDTDRIEKAREFRDAASARLQYTRQVLSQPNPAHVDLGVYQRTLYQIADGCEDRIHVLHTLFPEIEAIPVEPWPRK